VQSGPLELLLSLFTVELLLVLLPVLSALVGITAVISVLLMAVLPVRVSVVRW
jgi:hypothetical protein